MKKRVTLLQSATECHFHTIPGEIALITVAPERAAIFTHLARIDYARFPEFVSDILGQVEKHTDIQVTDGPGDETQDIFSRTPTGERHLTQCKHTVDPKNNCAPEELDRLFAACHRKTCTRGLLVTNADLTPQAKRYVTDGEFRRLSERVGGALVEPDYWNGVRIWERIATSSSILNKWFSGMGQTHGLRKFSFDLVIHRMPGGELDAIKAPAVRTALGCSTQAPEGIQQVALNRDVGFTIEDWFARDLDLGVNFIGPRTKHGLVNIPLSALRIHVTVADHIGQYRPAQFRDEIVRFIGDRALPALGERQWWHLIATTPQAFVFLQDIVEPKVISVSEAESYVRVGGSPVTTEKSWIFLSGADYQRLVEDDDDLHWKHVPTGTVIRLVLSQRPHPVAAYDHYLRQMGLVQRIAQYEFRAVERVSEEDFHRIRRLIAVPTWVMMSDNDGDLFWAFPADTDVQEIARVDTMMQQENFKVLRVTDEDRAKIAGWIDVTPPNDDWLLNPSESEMSVPVALDRRLLWLSREVPCRRPRKIATWISLLESKGHYEVQHGFDFMQGRKTAKMSSAEIQPFLFDIRTLRGSHMLDFALVKGKLNANLRVREESILSTNSAIPTYTAELDTLVKQIVDIVNNEPSHAKATPPVSAPETRLRDAP